MSPSTMPVQSAGKIHKMFTDATSEGAIHKTHLLAKKTFEATLEDFVGVGMLERQDVWRTSDIFAAPTRAKKSELHDIFQDRLDYIGGSISIIVFRRKEDDPMYGEVSLALFNDSTGAYQPISADNLISLLVTAEGFESRLEDVVIRTSEARRRVITAARSLSVK